MASVLVTGGAGFIGSHVARALVEQGNRVVALDSLDPYYDPARKLANVADLRDSDSFTFVQGDIRDNALVEKLFSDNAFDAVVHLAARAGVRASVDEPLLYYDVNLNGTIVLLEAARKQWAARSGNDRPVFVIASTSSVYGATERIPFTEDDPCDRPLAPYPASKRAAEMIGFAFHHLYGIDVTALRFFTVYGPAGRPDMMAYLVADNITRGHEVTLYDQGDMHRDWTYVDDITNGVLAASKTPLGYEVINLGRGQPTKLAEFVSLIETEFGERAQLVDATRPSTDIPYTYADIDKARRLLGYDPQVSVDEGVRRFAQWYQRVVLKDRS
ncbi:MAG: SDR family NAD(P)-dependent oxidoreductase [Actinomycetota bacterium]|nr:SDR family NAD(P)-dependent oxidoreductase [Actinomycetota bacterium]